MWRHLFYFVGVLTFDVETQTDVIGHVHDLWPCTAVNNGRPVPGCFICRDCYYVGNGTLPDPEDHETGLWFTIRDGRVFFKPP